MAIEYESNCVDCGLPCMENACIYYAEKHFYCDECKEEVGTLYRFEGDELCEKCVLKRLEKVE